MKRSDKFTIVCTDEGIYHNQDLLPQHAKNYVPSWYKNIKLQYDIDKEKPILSKIFKPRTVRQCPSFMEIFEEGYIIPAPTDYYLSLENENFEWKTPINYQTVYDTGEVQYHGNIQFVDHLPKNSNIKGVFKIILPYVVFAPKGYYLKLLPVPYEFNKDFHANYGIQSFDNIFELNIQINITSDKNEILIRRGQPLALVVPYKKENLQIEYKLLEEEKHYQKIIAKDKFSLINVFTHRYQKSKDSKPS